MRGNVVETKFSVQSRKLYNLSSKPTKARKEEGFRRGRLLNTDVTDTLIELDRGRRKKGRSAGKLCEA